MSINEFRVGPYRAVNLGTRIEADNPRLLACDKHRRADTGDFHTGLVFDSHLGTHVETPAHFFDGLPGICTYQSDYHTRQVGLGLRLRLNGIPSAYPIGAWEINAALHAAKLGRADLAGAIVLLDSPHHREPFTNSPDDPRPQLTVDAAILLRQLQIRALGFGDGISIEHDPAESLGIHGVLMTAGIELIEVLRNLDQIQETAFLFVCLPLPIVGLESSPVQPIAIEGVPGFRFEDLPSQKRDKA